MPINANQVLWDAPPKHVSTLAEFQDTYRPAAERASKALGVPANVILGQWGLETGWGKSIIPGTNNLGNIKDFAGGGVGATDNMTGSRDNYRAYDSPDAFVDDYVSLVQRKYPKALGAKNASAFAAALKDGGYAEDPRYTDKVTRAADMVDRQPGPVMAALGKVVGAVLPSAQAAEPGLRIDPRAIQWDEPAPAQRAASSINPNAVIWDTEKPEVPRSIPAPPNALFNPVGAIAGAMKSGGGLADAALGALRGSANIGNTIINSGTKAGANALSGIDDPNGLIDPKFKRPAGNLSSLITGRQPMSPAEQQNATRQEGLADFDSSAPSSIAYKAGKIGAEIAGTAGVGGVLAAPFRAAAPIVAGAAPAIGNYMGRIGNALASGGMNLGGQGGNLVANTALRVGTGAAATGAGAGLIDPNSAGTGAVIGGLLPPVIGTMARAGGAVVNGVRGLVDMATPAGQNRIAEAVMRASATDPAQAAARLAQARPVVPGSLPTTGQVAEDAGLAQLERTLLNNPQTAAGLQRRFAEQRAARGAAIDEVAATGPNSGSYYDDIQEGRRIFGNEDYAAARSAPIAADRAAELAPQIASLMERPSIRAAVGDARRLAAETGETIDDFGSVRGLDWVKKALDNQISKARVPNSSIGAEDLRALVQTRNDLNATLEHLVPAYREANRNFAAMSRQINGMDVARDLDRAYSPVASNFGSTAKEQGAAYMKAMRNAQDSVKGSTGLDHDLAHTMSTSDIFALENVARDLARKQYAESAGAAVGSPTAQNLLSQYFINRVAQGAGANGGGAASSTILNTLLRPLQFAGRLAEPGVNNRLLELYLNPQRAGQVLQSLPPAQANSLLQLFNQAPRAVPALTAD